MKLLIGIATYRRIEKLKRLLRSLENQTYKNIHNIHIVCDNNDYETAETMQKCKEFDVMKYSYSVNDSHKFVIGAWNDTIQNYILNKEWDGYIGLCDDVELHPNALEKIVDCHKKCFPDTDGVCGFKQECPEHKEYTFKWYGQTLIGRKFLERYKDVNYQVCCPDFSHFCQDNELWRYSSLLKRFINCNTAILNHYHPCFAKEELDETHNIIRSGKDSPKNRDYLMQFERQRAGYLWGKDFNLIGGSNG